MFRCQKTLVGLLTSHLLIGGALAQDAIRIGVVEFVRQSFELASGQPDLIAVNVYHDGHQDIVATYQTGNEVIVFRGDGKGHFTRQGRFPAGEKPVGLAAADFTGDSILDLVIANHETAYLTVLIGDGTGGFRPTAQPQLLVEVSPHPHAVHTADFDNDGHQDIVVDDRDRHGLLVLLGRGDGTFETPGVVVAVGGDPYRGMAIGDLNGDGRVDLITPNPDEVGIVLSSGPNGIGFAAPATLAMASPFAVNLADFNGDGNLDVIAVSDGRASRVEIFMGDGQGHFGPSGDSSYPIALGAKNIAVGDINGDGFADAMISSWNSDLVIVLGGPNCLQMVRLQSEGSPWGLAISDLNHDGKGDLIIADGIRSAATIFLSRSD